MPSDPYQITVSGDNEISITLSDVGVATPTPHASSHVTGGADPIQLATSSLSGLASAAHIATLEGHTTSIAANTSAIATINTTIGNIDSGVLSLGVSGGALTRNVGPNVVIGLPAASGAGAGTAGYMTAAQAQKLQNIAPDATANAISVTSPLTTSSVSGTQTVGILEATTIANGYLSKEDKTKLESVTLGAAVSSVSVNAPLVKTGTTAPTISLPAATGGAAGHMTALDKSKLDSLTASVATTTANGYLAFDDKIKLNSIGTGAIVTGITVESPLVKTGLESAPSLSIPEATTTANGYLSFDDKIKLNSLTTVAPQAIKTFYAGPISGANANPTFRTLVSSDLPVVGIAQGGTGATTKAAAVATLGFKAGLATVAAGVGSVLVADSSITASSIVVVTQEFMGTSSAPLGTADDLVIEWCVKTTAGETTVVTTELVQNTGSKFYALDPWDFSGASLTYSFFTDNGFSTAATDFIALFRGSTGPDGTGTNDTGVGNASIGHDFWDSTAMLPRRGLWNYDTEAQYDLTYCTKGTSAPNLDRIKVPQATNTWGVGKGGTLIIEPLGTSGMKVIIPRNLNMSKWGIRYPTGVDYSLTFRAMPSEKCYWFDGGFVPSTFTPPATGNIPLSGLVYPSTVTPKPIYINGVATNVMFPRLRLASEVLVNNAPSDLNRFSVVKTAGTGFTIFSSNTVDVQSVNYVSFTP